MYRKFLSITMTQKENFNNLTDMISTLNIDEKSDKVCKQILDEIKEKCESVFSWNIKEKTGSSQNLLLNFIDKINEKIDLIFCEDGVYDFNSFHMKLIICYELFDDGKLKESLSEIEAVIQEMKTKKFDEHYNKYIDVCFHIAYSTQAFILTTLNIESNKLLSLIKPVSKMKSYELAAICGIKSKVFIEYPPNGNDISLSFAEKARNLNKSEFEWISIWLKAKGRVRRFYAEFEIPDKEEVEEAKHLSAQTKNTPYLIQASNIFLEAGFTNKIQRKYDDSIGYYKLSSEIINKAVYLAGKNIKQLQSCLQVYLDLPEKFHSQKNIHKILENLSDVKNSRVDAVLGKYYLKHEKNYEKAKEFLSRAMSAGHFSSAIQLLKIECKIKPVNTFPYVETLNMIYDVFPSAKRRLIILSQILLYFYYYDDNSEELMHYLRLYLDQNIDDSFKKRHLIYACPLFKINENFKPKQFLYNLTNKVDCIRCLNSWNDEQKKMFNETLKKFNVMSKCDIKNVSNFDNDSERISYNVRSCNKGEKKDLQNWRKQNSQSKKIGIDNATTSFDTKSNNHLSNGLSKTYCNNLFGHRRNSDRQKNMIIDKFN